MTGTFPPALTAVHEPGTRAKMATIREVHSSLPIPSERIVRWLFTEHVGAPDMTSPWPLKEAKVKFIGPHTFDFDDNGEPALIFRSADHGETIDLVAWQARSGRLASWRGVAFAIGDVAEIWNPANYLFDNALPVHRTPLQWLQVERTGIVIIEPRDAYSKMRDCPQARVADATFGRQLERWIQAPKPTCEILVEVQEERRAA
jgi:hypothetical protein